MDLKELVDPIVEGTVWTFDNLLLPLTKGGPNGIGIFNLLAMAAITFGLVYWCVLQGKYNKKADAEGGIR